MNMTSIRKFLCNIGYHKWEEKHEDGLRSYYRECIHCSWCQSGRLYGQGIMTLPFNKDRSWGHIEARVTYDGTGYIGGINE